jgi:hypothetical protein
MKVVGVVAAAQHVAGGTTGNLIPVRGVDDDVLARPGTDLVDAALCDHLVAASARDEDVVPLRPLEHVATIGTDDRRLTAEAGRGTVTASGENGGLEHQQRERHARNDGHVALPHTRRACPAL